jgi:hypothetical protein
VTTDPLVAAFARPNDLAQLGARDWEAMIASLRATELIARLALSLESDGALERVPPAPRRHLVWARRSWEAQEQTLRWDVDAIGCALRSLGIPIVLLKGAAYAMAGLPAARGRLFSDIDIMVPKESIDEVEAALLAHGWASTKLDPYDQRYYREWMHELPPLQHFNRDSVLDVHHTIAPPTARHNVSAAKLFAAAHKLDMRGNFHVLAPPDMVLHSIVHLLQEGEFEHGLRDLMDVDQLLRHFGQQRGFWPALPERAAELGIGRPLYYAIDQVRRLLDTPVPAEALAAIEAFRPGPVPRPLMRGILRAGLASAPRGDEPRLTGLARWLLYVRGHYLRMPLRLLLPHLMRKGLRRESVEA